MPWRSIRHETRCHTSGMFAPGWIGLLSVQLHSPGRIGRRSGASPQKLGRAQSRASDRAAIARQALARDRFLGLVICAITRGERRKGSISGRKGPFGLPETDCQRLPLVSELGKSSFVPARYAASDYSRSRRPFVCLRVAEGVQIGASSDEAAGAPAPKLARSGPNLDRLGPLRRRMSLGSKLSAVATRPGQTNTPAIGRGIVGSVSKTKGQSTAGKRTSHQAR